MNSKFIPATRQIIPDSGVIEVTPEIAERMLLTSIGNRKLRRSHVDKLAASMKRGEWRLTSQGIGFDTTGALRDGHHRLSAVIKSGITINCLIVTGMPDDAYEVTDIGVLRTYSDRLNMDRKVADVLRLGCEIALKTSKPTIDQMRPIISGAFFDVVNDIINVNRTNRKFFASAPMRLAAVITLMNGGNREYVISQYQALIAVDFEAMSKASQTLFRQVSTGKADASNSRSTLTRGMKIFDVNNRLLQKLYITDMDVLSAHDIVASTLLKQSVKE